MAKFNWLLSTFVVSAAIASSMVTQLAGAQTNSSRSWQAIAQDFFNQQNDSPPPGPTGTGISRGGVCAISPRASSTTTEIWSDRPLFVWQSQFAPIVRIEVHPTGSNEVLWHPSVVGQTKALYDGKLQPGQTYDWLLFNTSDKHAKPLGQVTFRVIDGQKRQQIETRLQSLDKELKDKGATPEEIALQRANYFASQQLWSDVLQEVYSLKKPSPELIKIVQSIPKQICKPSRQNSVQTP